MTVPLGKVDRLHASAVAVAGRAVLIIGPSGAGKSSLALRMIALGALLVADDQTDVQATPQGLIASCPPSLAGLIEARGVGLLRAPTVDAAPVVLVIDLAQAEPDRLPPKRRITILGQELPLVLGGQSSHLAEAVFLCLQGGRHA